MSIPLGRQIHFDPKSKEPEFSARGLIGPTARYRRVWKPRFEALDQGLTNHCVGFSLSALLAATPVRHIVSNESSRILFERARAIDVEEGRLFPGGATILAGMKACHRLKLFGRYVWNFGIDDTIDWIVRRGPVILGIDIYEGMMDPGPSGLMEISGALLGGHAIMANGYWPQHPVFGDCLVLTNSYGNGWGVKGRGFLTIAAARELLSQNGESVAPTELPPRRIGEQNA